MWRDVMFLQRRWRGVFLAGAVVAGGWMLNCSNAIAERQTLNFNPDWKFIRGEVSGARAVHFNDANWQTVSAPHTYNDKDTFDDWSLSGHRGEQNQWGGRTWYRKTFTVPESFRGKKVFIEFEAVRQVAEVYLNGEYLGTCRTGFTPFGFDLTSLLRFDQPNVLAVMCDNRFMKDPWAADGAVEASRAAQRGGGDMPSAPRRGGKLSELSAHFNATIPEALEELRADQIPWNNPHWHPAHGGIYRNVYLHVTDPLHIPLPLYSFLQTTGPYVYAQHVSDAATVTVEVPVVNGRGQKQRIEVRVELFDAAGRSALRLRQYGDVNPNTQRDFKLSGVMQNPRLWAPASPNLYRVICSIFANGAEVDRCEIPLGIRSWRWGAGSGFYMNGKHLKLRGWGHKPTDEWPGLGAAHPDWMHYFSLQLMKDAGANLVRWGHCAGGPASIKAADQLGLITIQPGVDGESDTRGAAWTLRAMAFRDLLIYYRNHPSIAIWEGGNQKVSREHARELRQLMDRFDPHGGRSYAHRRADQVTAEFMDVGIGTEGGREIAHLPVVEGEYNREESPRRVWDDASPPRFGYPEAKGQTYQLTSEQFAVNQVAQFVQKLGAPEHAGGANWIFSDSTSGGRVTCEVARTSGEVDGMRLPKEAYFVCRTMFRADPQIHIIGHWSYPPATKKSVYVVANRDEVELFVNGRSLGRGEKSNRYLFTFPEVVWEPGEIRAVAYADGKAVATQTKRTAGAPVALRLTPLCGPGGWQADGADVVLVDVEAVDEQGERCPTFEQPVRFQQHGPAEWIGGYESGRTNSTYQTQLNLECGINRVALRAGRVPGEVTLTAVTDGLKSASLKLVLNDAAISQGIGTKLPELPRTTWSLESAVAAADILTAAEGDASSFAAQGRFIQQFSYSGPTAPVGVMVEAQDGKLVYVDRDYRFTDLPALLRGSDYVRAANADKQYSAVDLMEIAVPKGATVFVAHDDRLSRPAWLTRRFQPSALKVMIERRAMTVYRYQAAGHESLTLGPNSDTGGSNACNMYVVFVQSGSHESYSERGQY